MIRTVMVIVIVMEVVTTIAGDALTMVMDHGDVAGSSAGGVSGFEATTRAVRGGGARLVAADRIGTV